MIFKYCFTFSISSQLVTIPCSMGYFKVRIPLLDWASSPTYESFCPIPTITPWWRGRPTMDGKTALGASSPANPALHIPDPLSTTRAATSSSAIFLWVWLKWIKSKSKKKVCSVLCLYNKALWMSNQKLQLVFIQLSCQSGHTSVKLWIVTIYGYKNNKIVFPLIFGQQDWSIDLFFFFAFFWLFFFLYNLFVLYGCFTRTIEKRRVQIYFINFFVLCVEMSCDI